MSEEFAEMRSDSTAHRLKAVCFDAGDTLIFDHPSRYERTALALAACGLLAEPDLFDQAVREVDAFAIGRYLCGTASDDPALIAECVGLLLGKLGFGTLRETILAVVAAYEGIAPVRRLDSGAKVLLQQLRDRGYKIAVISDWDRNLPDVFEELGIRLLIDAFSISEVVGAAKPAPALFRDSVDQLGIQPQEAIHVGDFLELDVAGALSIGMHAILFDWKDLYGRSVARVPVVRTFPDLAALLLSLPVP